MARIKFSPGTDPVNNKHLGFTFQRNAYGFSMFPGARPRRARNVNQSQRMSNLMKAVNIWRSLDPAVILAWENFAATYPQASRRNPSVFLTGYQLFIKRAHYIYLNSGIEADIISYPKLESLANPVIDVSIESGENCLDITDLYISNFGIIPDSGQTVLCKIYPMAMESGQFFEAITQTITVTQVYVDGMFLSINWTAPKLPITFSVYLSKVINPGQDYTGTKVRFMGCFSAKNFLELTDTPDDYTGQGEKTVAVKADETGLEFVEGGGGGLSCEDLVDCPTIIQMLNQIQSLASLIIPVNPLFSVPPVNYGLLYNFYTTIDARNLLPSGYSIPTNAMITSLISFLGGASVASQYLKDTNILFWNTVSPVQNNSLLFNGRGSSFRSITGNFGTLGSGQYFWTADSFNTNLARATYFLRDTRDFYQTIYSKKYGLSIRAVKDTTILSDGESGTMVGNNGRIYRTICINGIEWLADNLAETHFRDGTEIPETTDSTTWSTLTSSSLSAFNNDWNNV